MRPNPATASQSELAMYGKRMLEQQRRQAEDDRIRRMIVEEIEKRAKIRCLTMGDRPLPADLIVDNRLK